MEIADYIKDFHAKLPTLDSYETPWEITNDLELIVRRIIATLNTNEFEINGNIAIHQSAEIEPNVRIKDNTIIQSNATVKAGSYLRSGVYIGQGTSIGANCEIKQSIVFDEARIAHLNYVGNSIIGRDVNMEAGSILANHHNDRQDKNIWVIVDGELISTGVTKFGSLLGDHVRIGANAVCNPGTIFPCGSVLGRLIHLDQVHDYHSKS